MAGGWADILRRALGWLNSAPVGPGEATGLIEFQYSVLGKLEKLYTARGQVERVYTAKGAVTKNG